MKHLMILVIVMFCIGSTSWAACPSADLSRDCRVDLEDFSLLAEHWLIDYDSDVLVTMASEWLTEGIPTVPTSMTWVHINDAGFNGYMSKYEITNAQYCQYLKEALASGDIVVDSYGRVLGAHGANPGIDYMYLYTATETFSAFYQITYSDGIFSVRTRDGHSMANHPVTYVSWYGATAFCNYYGYRLPSFQEWQAVADYDGSYTYYCGTTINFAMANFREFNYGAFANPLDLTSYPYTSPVGYYPAYGYGMCDMAGNAMEWNSTVVNLLVSGCGGSWSYDSRYCSVSGVSFYLYIDSCSMGFRVCR